MDETSYLKSRRLAGEAAGSPQPGTGLPVKLKLIDEAKFSHTGTTDFIDNAIDRASGTIRARAEFANPDGTLTPACSRAFRCRPAPRRRHAPAEVAVGTEQVKKFVLVVDAENIARPKYVTLGPVVEDLRVITSGLDPDDRVIVNGLMRARPGVKVAPREAAAALNRPNFAGEPQPSAN
jgi:multidrug efflux pump subunit AcrA (membrane-fusion protein)